jgi:hypothetical protein
MEVYLSKSTCSLQAILHLAVPSLLLDSDGRAVRGKMLVYFDPKQFSVKSNGVDGIYASKEEVRALRVLCGLLQSMFGMFANIDFD